MADSSIRQTCRGARPDSELAKALGRIRRRRSCERIATPLPRTALLAGCTTGAAEIPTPSVGGTEFPTGKFVNEEVNWALEFDEDGTWRGCLATGGACGSGKYATSGDLWTEMTHDFHARYGSPEIPATYYWTYDGKNLTFRLWGKDMIPSRQEALDGITYTKSE